MRTRSLLAAALVCCLLLLVACTSTVPKRKVESQPEAQAGTITIRYAYYNGFDQWMKPLVQGFQKAHPEYRIEPVLIDSDWTAATVKDEKADLVFSNAAPFDLVHEKLATDLEPYIRKSNMNLDAYKLDRSQYLIDGRIYGLPLTAHPRVLLGNADMFQKAGVALPGATWTWDEFRETVRKLTTADGKQWGLDSNAPEYLTQLRMMQYSVGTPAWLADEKAWKESLQFMTTVTLSDKSAAPIPQDGRGPLQRNGNPKEYMNGQAAIGMFVPGLRTEFNQVILPMPTIPNAKPVTYTWFFTLAIPANSKQPDAAWEFIRWMTGPDGALLMATNKILPMYITPQVEEAWLRTQPKGAEAILRSLWMGHFGSNNDMQMRMLMDQTINKALTGVTPWEKALANYLTQSAPLKSK
ncbi:MAG TPA: extracellular solute-binding protein [Symbiobacteriaceae bacterium]|nr:extracellular solute-binding protein [Symbiobacteriaceae bacterium]